MEKIKNLEKDKEISKDESFKFSDQVQEITDKLIEKLICCSVKRKRYS